jgi:hypothetical protein
VLLASRVAAFAMTKRVRLGMVRPPARPVVPIGAAFGLAIGGGRFAVCRVIGADRKNPANMLVAATRWIGTRAQLPRALRDPRTKRILAITHHNQFGKPYVVSVWNRPPRSFVSLGELLPSAAEQRLKRSYFEWATLKVFLFGDGDWFQKLVFAGDLDAIEARYALPIPTAVRATVVSGIPVFRDLLTNEDAAVRLAAASALAHVGEAIIADALLAQLELASDPAQQASILVACLYCAYRHPVTSRAITAALHALARSSEQPLVRGLALISWSALTRRTPDPSLHAELVAFFVATTALRVGTTLWIGGSEGPTSMFTWNAGAADLIALRVLADPAWRPVLARAMTTALPSACLLTAPARFEWPIAILSWCFPPRDFATDPVAPHELTPTQREFLEYLSQVGVAQKFSNYSPYVQFGLPSDMRSRQRMLGLRPPGILETIVHIDRDDLPLWRALAARFLAYDQLPNDRRPPLQTFLAITLPDFTARQWLDIWIEVEVHAYSLVRPNDPNPDPPLVAAMTALPDADVIAWAHATLEELLREPDPERRLVQFYATWGLVKRHQTWDEKYDAAVTLYGGLEDLVEVFAALPEGRRERTLARLIEEARLDGTWENLRSRVNELRARWTAVRPTTST